jgi:hypothetical protein
MDEIRKGALWGHKPDMHVPKKLLQKSSWKLEE